MRSDQIGKKSFWSRIAQRLGSFELITLVTLISIVGGMWLFLEITDLVLEQETIGFDQQVLLTLRHPDQPSQPVGPAWLVLIARDITALGGYTFLFLLTGLLVLYFGLKHRPAPLLLLLATILGGTAINRVMKFFFARERPDIEWLVEVTSKSFPSGHAMLSAAVYLTLATLLAQRESRNSIKVFFLGSAMLLTFLVGTSRIYLGVHFPTDVLAGWIAGSVWAMICLLVAGHIRHRRQKTAPTTSRPSSG